MPTKCLSLVRGRRIRLTRLDGCGRPVFGASSSVTSSGFISVAFTANTTESDEISVTNAAGEVCVFEPAETSLTGYGVEIQFCEVDPDLFALVTGQPVITDAQGNVIGFDIDTATSLSGSGFALELWAGSVSGDACVTSGAQGSFGYLLLPFIRGGIVGDFTVENGNVTFTITGGATRDGNTWGVGPYSDVQLSGGTNEQQRFTITGTPTGGSFTATYSGQTTAAIAYNATASAVQSALEALSNIDSGDVLATGGPLPGTAVTVEFKGRLAATDVATMTATGSLTGGTTPTVAVTTPTAGVAGTPGPMFKPIGSTVALRTMLTSVAPPAAACGARPLPDTSLPALTGVAGVATGKSVAFTVTPASVGPVYYEFGDGTWDYVVAPGTTTHVYPSAATYTAKATQNGKWVTTSVTTT